MMETGCVVGRAETVIFVYYWHESQTSRD